ncbi:MAG TPA: PilZ domain-containing protein [Vicinamibacterales bacterium]|jgi:hypothetical protein
MHVLALERDQVQAESIRRVVCGIVGAKLTLVESMDRILRLIQAELPDLILLPALVSPVDEQELITALRALPDGLFTQTQITPSFGSKDEEPNGSQGWRRWTSRRVAVPGAASGEMEAFAERVRWSLECARERRPAVEHALTAAAVASMEPPHIDRPTLVMPIDSGEIVAPGTLLSLLQDFDEADIQDVRELRLADATSRLLDKLDKDRRRHKRFSMGELPGLRSARIKFGPYVALVDVSAGGALLQTDAQLQPETEAMLELFSDGRQTLVPFRVLRCQNAELEGTPRYLGACAFKHPLDLDSLVRQSVRRSADAIRSASLHLASRRPAVRNSW